MSRKHLATRRRLSLETLEDRVCLSSLSPGTSTTASNAATQAHLSAAYGQLPLSFEANQGQTDARVNFLSRGAGYSLFLTPTKAVLSLKQGDTSSVVGMRIVGANPASHAVGLDRQAGVSNYFIGNDSSNWHGDVPNYGKVSYKGVYRGINLVYHGNQKQLEYDFVVAPGADPRAIRLAFDGAQSVSLDRAGNLVLHTTGGDVVEHAPVVYQEINGQRQAVAGRYVLKGNHQVGFQLGQYDHSKPLVIDPTLSYSTYLGGGKDDYGNAIAVDSSGNAYVTGTTASNNFPTKHPWQGGNAGGNSDVFVTKLNAAGTALVYSTFLGGSGSDEGYGIAVGTLTGNAYLTGLTGSTNFPTSHAVQDSWRGGWDSFVTELNAAGSALVYSTYLGGSGDEAPPTIRHQLGIALSTDTSGNTFAYVAGGTTSTDFPTTAGAYQVASAGSADAFVTKFDPTGAVVYASYLGGTGIDGAAGIAADTTGNAYLTGYTRSTNLPTTPGAFQTAFGGGNGGGGDAFVTKFNPAGSGLVYSTYLGGPDSEVGAGIAVDSSGNAYVAGEATGYFPTTSGAYQASPAGVADIFVSKVNATGTALLYSTLLGGSAGDRSRAIAVDDAGNAYVTGHTQSINFPIKNAFQSTNAGQDAFVTKLNPALSGPASLVYSSYLGGSGSEEGDGIALDGSSNAYVTGFTSSIDFPTKNPFQALKKNSWDAFVTKIRG
jgi:hypothetical protein